MLTDVVVTMATGLEALVGSCVMNDGFCLSMIFSSLASALPKRAMTAASTASHVRRPRRRGIVSNFTTALSQHSQ